MKVITEDNYFNEILKIIDKEATNDEKIVFDMMRGSVFTNYYTINESRKKKREMAGNRKRSNAILTSIKEPKWDDIEIAEAVALMNLMDTKKIWYNIHFDVDYTTILDTNTGGFCGIYLYEILMKAGANLKYAFSKSARWTNDINDAITYHIGLQVKKTRYDMFGLWDSAVKNYLANNDNPYDGMSTEEINEIDISDDEETDQFDPVIDPKKYRIFEISGFNLPRRQRIGEMNGNSGVAGMRETIKFINKQPSQQGWHLSNNDEILGSYLAVNVGVIIHKVYAYIIQKYTEMRVCAAHRSANLKFIMPLHLVTTEICEDIVQAIKKIQGNSNIFAYVAVHTPGNKSNYSLTFGDVINGHSNTKILN